MNLAKNWVVLALISVFSSLLLWVPAGMNQVYENFDGPYYLVVAKSWYNKSIIASNFSFPLPLEYYPAHFPLYPLAINLLKNLPGINGPRAMVGINIVFATAGAIAIFEIFKRLKINNPMFIAVLWLFWWPRMWLVRSVGSPETLFIFWSIVSLYFFHKQKYWLAGILGALAVLTKSPGILLFIAYGLWGIWQTITTKKIPWRIYPILLIPLALLGLFNFYYLQTGDFWAYFHSGDNIHLQVLPFRIFDSNQPWVGDFWLEDVLWIYLVGAVGIVYAWKKNKVFALFGAVFYATLLFVSHRDLSRYSLPIVPVVLLGLSEIFAKKEIRWVLTLLIIPLYFYSLNFLVHNIVGIGNWSPFL